MPVQEMQANATSLMAVMSRERSRAIFQEMSRKMKAAWKSVMRGLDRSAVGNQPMKAGSVRIPAE